MTPLYAVLILAWASLASAEGARGAAATGLGSQTSPTIVSHDPLIEQIRSRQLTQPNGGVRAAVRIASGQSVELKVTELGFEVPLKPAGAAAPAAALGLKTHPGLLPKELPAEKGKSARGRKATEQLRGIELEGPRRGWTEKPTSPVGR